MICYKYYLYWLLLFEYASNMNDTSDITEEDDGTKFYRDETTVFCDKYESDISKSTVANRLATVIIEYEQEQGYNGDIDDEIEIEEPDLKEIDRKSLKGKIK